MEVANRTDELREEMRKANSDHRERMMALSAEISVIETTEACEEWCENNLSEHISPSGRGYHLEGVFSVEQLREIIRITDPECYL